MLMLLFALMLSTGSDYSSVVMTRYPEGYIPETMEEWQTTQPPAVPLIVDTVFSTGSERDETGFLVIFENGLASAVGSSLIEQWATDINCNGLTVEVVEVTYSTPEELKEYLAACHEHGLEGAVLVGDLPVAWSMIDNDFLDSRSFRPITILWIWMEAGRIYGLDIHPGEYLARMENTILFQDNLILRFTSAEFSQAILVMKHHL